MQSDAKDGDAKGDAGDISTNSSIGADKREESA
jgi:hypothetical protein